jgi:hypothetical protein
MSFVASVLEAIVDVIVFIVEAVVQMVEMVVQLIMVLLGWDTGSTQIIEYYEVHNIPLFEDPDKNNPLLNSLLQSILSNEDIAGNLIYNLAFRSLKTNVKEFMKFIEDGNYFENFPTVESFILTIDYTELTAALNTLNGVPCTPEGSFLRALSKTDWIKYWLQENKEYNVGTNTMGVDYSTTSTSPASIAADTVSVTPSTNHFDISITSGIATADEAFADERWQVDLTDIVYNSTPDTYTIKVYNAVNVGAITRTLPYTAPTKPIQLHYVSTYYRDSAPARKYLFIYKVGTGVYTDLDTVETPIDQDGTTIKAFPAIPLRLSNSNYTTFGATKQAQIDDILKIIHLDAEEILDTILTRSGTAPGDLDHIYVNFGVRMWDTSQAGMSYLFTMFQNLYPSQGVTQGTYNNTAAGDEKPQNNILITTDDNKLAFQWSYITYEHTSLTDINANSSSVENGIYYSDMSKFSGGILVYPYYVSSGKGTYNVGYKADTLDEVQDFLDGNGVTNPGTTSTEAANWLQVTTRLSYNNPTPNLLEADDSAADLKYLTPDLVYENNGSGVLRLIQQASPETTIGQSITYYCVKPAGLDAYTVFAPIASCRVVDGSSGHFRVVKFNLGNKTDLLLPFIHTFIKDLSHDKVARLFLAGCHASIYIAHYELIVHEGMSFLTALVLIIIIVVVAVLTWGADGGTTTKALMTLLSTTATTVAINAAINVLLTKLVTMAIKMIVQYVVKLIIVELVGEDSELAMILGMLSSIAIGMWDPGVTVGSGVGLGELQPGSYGPTGGIEIGPGTAGSSIEFASSPGISYSGMSFNVPNFSDLNAWDIAKFAIAALDTTGKAMLLHSDSVAKDLAKDYAELDKFKTRTSGELIEKQRQLDLEDQYVMSELRFGDVFSRGNCSAEAYLDMHGAYIPLATGKLNYSYSAFYDQKCTVEGQVGI